MYRAVMEEVARFLERYQSQKQLQQQQQQQQQKYQEYQLQQTVAIHKQKNNNNKVEQIPRSKSLFQVYIAGGHEKSTIGCGGGDGVGSNSALDATPSSYSPTASSSSLSYLRARSSTNLIDLKNQQTVDDTANNKKKLTGHSKDDQDCETGLKPSQSYSALKDLTW